MVFVILLPTLGLLFFLTLRFYRKQKRLGDLLDLVQDPVLVVTPQGQLKEFNRRAGEVFPALLKKPWLQSLKLLIPPLWEYGSGRKKTQGHFTLLDGGVIHSWDLGIHNLSQEGFQSPLQAWILRDKTKEQEMEQQIDQFLVRDPLTEVWNQRYWEEQGAQEVHRAQRYHRPLTLLVFTFSRPDPSPEALQIAARYLDRTLRSTDLLGRVGDNRFAALLPETAPEAGRALGERLKAGVLKELEGMESSPLDLVLSWSGGDEIREESLEDLFKDAQRSESRGASAGAGV